MNECSVTINIRVRLLHRTVTPMIFGVKDATIRKFCVGPARHDLLILIGKQLPNVKIYCGFPYVAAMLRPSRIDRNGTIKYDTLAVVWHKNQWHTIYTAIIGNIHNFVIRATTNEAGIASRHDGCCMRNGTKGCRYG